MLTRFKQALETQCDEIYITSWKDLFPEKFKYPEKAIIRNKLLASANKLLQLGVLIVFIYFFFVDEEYMLVYIPNVHGKFWASKGNYTRWDEELLTGTAPNYCNNTDYNWVHPDDDYHQYIEASCVHPMFYETIRNGESGMFFMTYFHEATFMTSPCENFTVENCKQDYSQYYVYRDSQNKTCKCETISNHFTVGVEDINLILEHEFSVTGTGHSGKDGEMTTIVRDHTGREIGHPDGVISYSIGQWFDWSGISLDDFNEYVEDHSGDHPTVKPTATYPRIRQTGVKIRVELKYYNMQKFQSKWRGASTVAYVDISAVPQWQDYGSGVQYIHYPDIPKWHPKEAIDVVYSEDMVLVNRYGFGALFSISGSGYIGQIDLDVVKGYFIDVVCMMGYIPLFIAVCASALFGFKSSIYRGQLNHDLDGEMKVMEHFRKVFKNIFSDYWEHSYHLNWDEFHDFCQDRRISEEDEVTMRDEVIFQHPKKRGDTLILTARMFFCALEDPDPDGTIDKYWAQWDAEYVEKKRDKWLIELATYTDEHHKIEKGEDDELLNPSDIESSSDEFPNVRRVVYEVEEEPVTVTAGGKNIKGPTFEEMLEPIRLKAKKLQNIIDEKSYDMKILEHNLKRDEERLGEIREKSRKKFMSYIERLGILERICKSSLYSPRVSNRPVSFQSSGESGSSVASI